MVDGHHIRNEIYPLLHYDVKHHTKIIQIKDWVNTFLGVSPEKLSRWTGILRAKAILLDSTIEENMQVYRDRSRETDGYLPWSIIANRIVEIAHKCIPDLPPYKLNDLIFVRNDPIQVDGNGPYHAQRSPDVVITLQNHLRSMPSLPPKADLFTEGFTPTSGISWYGVIGCVEFKPGKSKEAFEMWEGTVNSMKRSLRKTRTRRGPKAKVWCRALSCLRCSPFLATGQGTTSLE